MASLSQDLRQGLASQQAGRLPEARACYEKILQHEPQNPQVRHLLALVDLASSRIAEAVALLRQCVALRPQFPEALTTLGRALLAQDLPLEALAAHEAALAINPKLGEAHGNRGNTLKFLHRTEEAIAAYQQGLRIRPDSADLKYNEALTHLLRGDLRRGWGNYERRWDRKKSAGRRPFRQPLWDGKEPLPGKTILIHAEQGLGDTLQFVRYLPLLSAQGAEVLLEVQSVLRPLLAAQFPARTVWARNESLPRFDLHCPLLSLPGAFATGLDSIPAADGPYLKAPPEKTAGWGRRFELARRPRIGLAWSGSAAHRSDRQRSIPFAQFQAIIRDRPGSFFSVQKEVRPADAALLATTPEVTDLAPELHDFADTAAILANLDLLVTADTAVAHLAGALGVRTWLLLPFFPDWRWLLGRTDSPWYGSLRLFRQPAPGDWAAVVQEVRSELGRWQPTPAGPGP